MLATSNIETLEAERDLGQAVVERTRALDELIERHQRLLECMTDRLASSSCSESDCQCRRVLRETLTESISVLEGTRKSFKSRQLADLRQKLLKILADHT